MYNTNRCCCWSAGHAGYLPCRRRLQNNTVFWVFLVPCLSSAPLFGHVLFNDWWQFLCLLCVSLSFHPSSSLMLVLKLAVSQTHPPARVWLMNWTSHKPQTHSQSSTIHRFTEPSVTSDFHQSDQCNKESFIELSLKLLKLMHHVGFFLLIVIQFLLQKPNWTKWEDPTFVSNLNVVVLTKLQRADSHNSHDHTRLPVMYTDTQFYALRTQWLKHLLILSSSRQNNSVRRKINIKMSYL